MQLRVTNFVTLLEQILHLNKDIQSLDSTKHNKYCNRCDAAKGNEAHNNSIIGKVFHFVLPLLRVRDLNMKLLRVI